MEREARNLGWVSPSTADVDAAQRQSDPVFRSGAAEPERTSVLGIKRERDHSLERDLSLNLKDLRMLVDEGLLPPPDFKRHGDPSSTSGRRGSAIEAFEKSMARFRGCEDGGHPSFSWQAELEVLGHGISLPGALQPVCSADSNPVCETFLPPELTGRDGSFLAGFVNDNLVPVSSLPCDISLLWEPPIQQSQMIRHSATGQAPEPPPLPALHELFNNNEFPFAWHQHMGELQEWRPVEKQSHDFFFTQQDPREEQNQKDSFASTELLTSPLQSITSQSRSLGLCQDGHAITSSSRSDLYPGSDVSEWTELTDFNPRASRGSVTGETVAGAPQTSRSCLNSKAEDLLLSPSVMADIRTNNPRTSLHRLRYGQSINERTLKLAGQQVINQLKSLGERQLPEQAMDQLHDSCTRRMTADDSAATSGGSAGRRGTIDSADTDSGNTGHVSASKQLRTRHRYAEQQERIQRLEARVATLQGVGAELERKIQEVDEETERLRSREFELLAIQRVFDSERRSLLSKIKSKNDQP